MSKSRSKRHTYDRERRQDKLIYFSWQVLSLSYVSLFFLFLFSTSSYLFPYFYVLEKYVWELVRRSKRKRKNHRKTSSGKESGSRRRAHWPLKLKRYIVASDLLLPLSRTCFSMDFHFIFRRHLL